MINHLSVEVIKRSCAFVMDIHEPEETLKKLMMFFLDRHIIVDNLQMYRGEVGYARLIIHCGIEKDRIARTEQLMGYLPGIATIERLEKR